MVSPSGLGCVEGLKRAAGHVVLPRAVGTRFTFLFFLSLSGDYEHMTKSPGKGVGGGEAARAENQNLCPPVTVSYCGTLPSGVSECTLFFGI